MKKKRKKIGLSPEFYARGEEIQRLGRERLAFHRKRREDLQGKPKEKT
jgi:hypothetical protein